MYEFGTYLRQSHAAAHLVESGLEFSNRIINQAESELTHEVYRAFQADILTNIAIGIVGSFGRGEAQPDRSDADLFVSGIL